MAIILHAIFIVRVYNNKVRKKKQKEKLAFQRNFPLSLKMDYKILINVIHSAFRENRTYVRYQLMARAHTIGQLPSCVSLSLLIFSFPAVGIIAANRRRRRRHSETGRRASPYSHALNAARIRIYGGGLVRHRRSWDGDSG